MGTKLWKLETLMIRWVPINTIFIFLYVFFFDNIMGGGDDCSSFDEKYSIKAGVKLVICVKKLNGFMNPFAFIIIIVIIICFSLFCSAFYIAIYFPKISNHPFVHLFVTLPFFLYKKLMGVDNIYNLFKKILSIVFFWLYVTWQQ